MSAWIKQIFTAGQANAGNIVRRSVHSVEKYSSVKDLKREVKSRKFHMAKIGDQYVIVCDQKGTIRVVC
jgi:DNA-directed RNA polymerase sigma subunit (sigma70/sigma32)